MSIIASKLGDDKKSLDVLIKGSENNPYDTRFYSVISSILIKVENYKDAVVYLEKARSFDKNDLNILKKLMNVLLQLESYERLEKVCKEILKLDKSNIKAISILIKCYKKNGKFTELNKLLKKIQEKTFVILRVADKDEEVTIFSQKYKKGQLNEKLIEDLKTLNLKLNEKLIDIENHQVYNVDHNNIIYKDAFSEELKNTDIDYVNNLEFDNEYSNKDIKKYLQKNIDDPENQDTIYKLGLAFFKIKEYEKSKYYFMKLSEDYKPASVKEKLGDIMFKDEKNYYLAIDNYEKVPQLEKNHVVLLKLGKCHEKLENIDKAITYYRKSLEVSKDYVSGLFHLGWILCRKDENKDNISEGIKLLKRGSALDPTNNEIVIKLCEILYEREETLDEGIEIIRSRNKGEVVDINVELLMCESKGYDKKGEYDKAVRKLEKAYKFPEFKQDADKLYLLAQEYQKIKNYTKASQMYKAVLGINPNHIEAIYHLTNILIQANEFLRAEKYYKHALTINNQLSFAYYGLGKIYQSLKKNEESMDEYANCIKYDPGNYK